MEIVIEFATAQSRGDLGHAVAKEPVPLPRAPGAIRQGQTEIQ